MNHVIMLGSGKRKVDKGRQRAFKILKGALLVGSLAVGGGALLGGRVAGGLALRALGRGAGTGLLKRAPKTTLGAAKLVAGAGLVSGLGVSGVTGVVKKVFKTGRKAGEILSGEKSAEDVLGITKKDTAKEKVVKGLVGAGVVGGAVILGKEIIKRRKEKSALIPKVQAPALIPTPALKQLGFTDQRPVGLGGVPAPLRAPAGAVGVPAQTLAKSPGTIIQISI